MISLNVGSADCTTVPITGWQRCKHLFLSEKHFDLCSITLLKYSVFVLVEILQYRPPLFGVYKWVLVAKVMNINLGNLGCWCTKGCDTCNSVVPQDIKYSGCGSASVVRDICSIGVNSVFQHKLWTYKSENKAKVWGNAIVPPFGGNTDVIWSYSLSIINNEFRS